jgi:hypothetical protein
VGKPFWANPIESIGRCPKLPAQTLFSPKVLIPLGFGLEMGKVGKYVGNVGCGRWDWDLLVGAQGIDLEGTHRWGFCPLEPSGPFRPLMVEHRMTDQQKAGVEGFEKVHSLVVHFPHLPFPPQKGSHLRERLWTTHPSGVRVKSHWWPLPSPTRWPSVGVGGR